MNKIIETVIKHKECIIKLLTNFVVTFLACYLAISSFTNIQNAPRRYRPMPPPPPPIYNRNMPNKPSVNIPTPPQPPKRPMNYQPPAPPMAPKT